MGERTSPANGSGKDKGKDRGKTEASDKGDSASSARTIFVKGFDFGTDDDALTNHFRTVGAIEDHHFQSKFSAVITYVKASAAQQALTKLDGSTMRGQSRYLDVKLDDRDRNGGEGSELSRTAKGSGLDRKGSVKVSGTDSGRANTVQPFESASQRAKRKSAS